MKIDYTECDKCKSHIDSEKGSIIIEINYLFVKDNKYTLHFCPSCYAWIKVCLDNAIRSKDNG